MAVKQCPEVLGKTTGEVKYYNFEFADDMDTGEVLTGASVSSLPSTGITLATATYSGTIAQVKITGGTVGQEYRIIMQATTDGGETLEASGILEVETY